MVTVKLLNDEHPTNAPEILEKLEADAIRREGITPEDLSQYDQDHYGGLEATDVLVARLGIEPGMQVLELCSGVGGTTCYLPHHYSAQVLGNDAKELRVAGARSLTELAELQDGVDFRVGDSAAPDLPDKCRDRIVSQEAFQHIPDRAARRTLAEDLAALGLASAGETVALLRGVGFSDVVSEDLSENWKVVLHGRLETFRTTGAGTVARFGRERQATYIRNYEDVVAQIDAGAIGGSRFIAWRR